MRSHLSAFLAPHKTFFETGKTRSLAFRKQQLKLLLKLLQVQEDTLLGALAEDLGKPQQEAYVSEISFVREEIRFALRHLNRWSQPERVGTAWLSWPSRARIYSEPKGLVLILGPWNYPLQLILSPLVGAIAAGNCAVIKPSELAPATSRALANLIHENFDPGFLKVAEGGVEVAQFLLQEPFDHIFYTGGTHVGRIVMEAASKNLTPVTLELGGKSPCIVDSTAPLEVTARRVVWGKFFNAGQTCIAPDYVLVEKAIRDRFLELIKKTITDFFGADPRQSKDYGRIISTKHLQRLTQYLKGKTPYLGGEWREEERYLAPTILTHVLESDPVMQDEIFGPILPVLDFDQFDDALRFVNQRPKPLALYLFSQDRARQRRVVEEVSFGGGCINDTLMHLSSPHLPFGGIGPSGMGAYHGKYTFDTFSHQKSVLHRGFSMDLTLRYPPYRPLDWFRKFLG